MSPITGVPNLWDLMPEVELMNNIRNKVHKKCNVLESSQNYPPTNTPTPVHGKIVFHETGTWCKKDWGLLNRDEGRSI